MSPPGPAVLDVESVVSTYRDAVEDLPRERSDTAPERVMRALRARDRVAAAMSSAGTSLPGETLKRLVTLDERLKSSAVGLADAVGNEVLAGWRETLRPSSDAWWWSLDERAMARLAQNGLGWQLLGGLLVTMSITLSVDISQRFLSGGLDLFGIFSALFQAVLALLAGSTFTGFEHKWLERFFSRRAARPDHQALWRLGLALAIFGVILSLKLSLPAIARLYEQRGQALADLPSVQDPKQAEQRDEKRNYRAAIEHFQRAIALEPSFVQAHFHLAVTYEEAHEYDKAISAYEQALREYESAGLSDKLPQLYNNLARLHVRGGNHERALQLLEEAFEKHKQGLGDTYFAYAIHKNRGWARLKLELYHHATLDLSKALALHPDATGAHCLLALVHENQEQKEQALGHWQSCLANHHPRGEPVEAEWIEKARERTVVKLKGQP